MSIKMSKIMIALFLMTIVVGDAFGANFRIARTKRFAQFAPLVTPAILNGTEPTPSSVTGYEQDRIVGGELATIKEFPYLVNIRYKTKHICGGSYVHPLWVLTAAHCLLTYKKLVLTCAMGMTYLNDYQYQLRNSTGLFPHEYYNARNDSNDIGLIRIVSPFEGSVRIALVRLPEKPIKIREKCKVAGWGIMHQDDVRDPTKLSNQLRYVEVPIITQKRCSELYYLDQFQAHFKDTKIFCAGYEEGGHDACQGDSGGPIVCHNIQVGVVSWGIGCGNELPGVYSNVSSFLPWIKEVIKSYDEHHLRSDNLSYSTATSRKFAALLIMLYYSTASIYFYEHV